MEDGLVRLREQLEASGGHPLLARLTEQVDQLDFDGALLTLAGLARALNIPWGGGA
ncbi:MAG: hypothetical protein HQL37_03300 [Alphaproteobacteria bacterium]|nr:hypothetical protein [Alphaproteobacteria bacterium]